MARIAWRMALIGACLLAALPVAKAQSSTSETQRFPDVLSAKVFARGPGIFDFDVTISSPYDTPARYADAFRVSARDGAVLGERILLHDHAGEQPFTRDLHAVRIPPGINAVIVQGRDKTNGYGGKPLELELPGRNER